MEVSDLGWRAEQQFAGARGATFTPRDQIEGFAALLASKQTNGNIGSRILGLGDFGDVRSSAPPNLDRHTAGTVGDTRSSIAASQAMKAMKAMSSRLLTFGGVAS